MGEIGNNGTIAEFLLKDPHTIKVFDMSAFKLNCAKHFQDDQRKEQLIVIWPLIAACNSIAYCCPVSKKECQSIKRNFKIEYVIPQMFAAYLKSKNTVDGIRYYTVRDENLDPKAINMMDIVLFTKYSSETHYDEELLTKFDISIVPDN